MRERTGRMVKIVREDVIKNKHCKKILQPLGESIKITYIHTYTMHIVKYKQNSIIKRRDIGLRLYAGSDFYP